MAVQVFDKQCSGTVPIPYGTVLILILIKLVQALSIAGTEIPTSVAEPAEPNLFESWSLSRKYRYIFNNLINIYCSQFGGF